MTIDTIAWIRKIPIIAAIAILIFIIGPLFSALFFGLILASLGWQLQDLFQSKTSLSKRTTQILAPITIALTSILILWGSGWSVIALYKIGSVSFEESRIKGVMDTFEKSQTFDSLNRMSVEMNMGSLPNQYEKVGQALLSSISEFLGSLASSLPNIVLGFFICGVVFLSIYFNRSKLDRFRDSQDIISPRLLRYLGESFENYSYSTFFATLVCALSQGLIIALGAGLSGVGRTALWGAIASMLALLPYVGTAPVSLALTAYLYISEGMTGNTLIMMSFGIFASLIDNILRPVLLKGDKKQSPLVAFLAIFGGLYAMGPAGIFIGPILCGISIDLLEYKWAQEHGLDPTASSPETSQS